MTYNKFLLEQSILVFTLNNGPFLNLNDSPSTNISHIPETLPERISKEFIIQGMKFILENNFFLFNGKAYKQIKGTAMGTKVAPTYANLVMGYWETFLYKEVAKHFMEHHLYFIQNWKHYLDDCLILWPGTEEDMDKLKSIINNIHPDIQFK